MNYALILAGGVGQRMRSSGMPKQFLEVFRKPVIIYTLEKFEDCPDIDEVIVVCNSSWTDHMVKLIHTYALKKVKKLIKGGKSRPESVRNGIHAIIALGAAQDDIVVIHDGVRPLIETAIISENIRVAKQYGSAMTVRPVMESVVITESGIAGFGDFKKRDHTYSLTAPQTFTLENALCTLSGTGRGGDNELPLLDSALAYTHAGNRIHLVMENNHNIKITTPEDYYILKALLELEENRYVFGI